MLLVLLSFSSTSGLHKIPLISIPQVYAVGDNSSLIGNLETIVNAVNYTEGIDVIYQGMMVGQTSMQQLINAYNSLTDPMAILKWTPILSKLGYINQTTIEWALDNQHIMGNGLPGTYSDGFQEAFLVSDRYMILGYGYAIQYNYDIDKWNLTKAYDSFKSAVAASAHPALLYIKEDGTSYTSTYGPRYYIECAQTIDCFLDFYNLGITEALNDSLATWLWVNNNLWSGTHYNYALSWPGYECGAGGFFQIALKLWHADNSLPDTQRLLSDIENRFLQEKWLSPQWTTKLGGNSSYVVVHMTSYTSQLRLENTAMAWAAIFGSYSELNNTYQSDVQDMLAGSSPAWWELLQSPLCGSTFPYFSEHSDSAPSNESAATGANLLFILGIVPQTTSLAVPIEENSYDYIYNIFAPDMFNINLTNNVVTLALAAAGTLNFQFNQTVTGNFGSSGIYTVQFSSDWNNILNINFVSELPSNRNYVYTAPLSYFVTSADSHPIISSSSKPTLTSTPSLSPTSTSTLSPTPFAAGAQDGIYGAVVVVVVMAIAAAALVLRKARKTKAKTRNKS